MKIEHGFMPGVLMLGVLAFALCNAVPARANSAAPNANTPVQAVVTLLPGPHGDRPQNLAKGDLMAFQGDTPAPVIGLQRLSGDLADMQLFLFLDDSTRTSSLGSQIPELKKFIVSLPATTQVAIGYMRNGGVALAQAFTADHQLAAHALRLPVGTPGENGSPYFALSDLAKHWPSKQATGRRAVLMLTDGVDRYYTAATIDDPYLDAAIHDVLKQDVMVYSIYLRGAGFYGLGAMTTNMAQSRLIALSEKTGGHAYFEGFSDPVAIAPFLNDLEDRFANQYQVTVDAMKDKARQPVKWRAESPNLKIEGPTEIYVP
jgi:hypothetical protein